MLQVGTSNGHNKHSFVLQTSKANPTQPKQHSNTFSKPIPIPSSMGKITPGFAYELLMCQMQLECQQTISSQLVARLFELYKQGVEYYNLRRDIRQHYFRRKLEGLTNHPAVLDTLHRNSEDNFYRKMYMERKLEMGIEKSNIKVHEMIKKVDDVGKKCHETVRKHIENQVVCIQRRRQARKAGAKTCKTARSKTSSFLQSESSKTPREHTIFNDILNVSEWQAT